ncbi:HipA domain-containing protein [Curtobacterium sp. MCPF17_002]|uniref:type II toxin-antitoxin system HipA family toxin n=1 Tax=Curtobacterium sp. MCPF17_002 TaxID=2175645 RepID=UPI000DA8D9E9|nr:HipA domain-containing protein [Curtobacterium sp. MCPF17_002]WIB76911.1 HipA domain-containing protein [Curtobacterium sp. MCPF17_002]
MGDLTVALHGTVLGRLLDRGRDFDFRADAEAIRQFGLGNRVLSRAVPLVPRPQAAQLGLRQNFFSELLPEGQARERLAREAGVRETDVVGMLRAFGRDVAGAVQLWDPDVPGEPKQPDTEPIDDDDVADLLRNVQAAPLGNTSRRSKREGKSSLNGVQNKIVLVRDGDRWSRALDGYPSTHILKPVVGRLPTVIFDEEYGSRFARALGLAAFETTLQVFGGVTALVIERYDRSPAAPEGRIHQEDCNQVLGCAGDEKYEKWGGRGLRDVAKQLAGQDLPRLLRLVTMSVAVGNLDLHLKNISVLHDERGGTALAPAYDIVPQHFQRNDGEMGLDVNGVRSHAAITRDDLVGEGASWGVRDADEIVRGALAEIELVARAEMPHIGAEIALQESIQRMAGNLLDGRPVGGSTASPARRDGGWGIGPVHDPLI